MKKKTIAILLVLVIGMVGVFAATTPFVSTAKQTLELSTSVAIANAFIITDAPADANDTFYSVFGAVGDLDTTTERAVDVLEGIPETYLIIGTNSTAGFELYLDEAPAMVAIDTDTVIDYTIKVLANDDVVVAWDTSGDKPAKANRLIINAKASSETGAALFSRQITVEIDDVSYYAATAGSYSADVVFNVTTT